MIKIIIADDHEIIRTCFSTLFNSLPELTIVAEASNGREAIELARKHKPDVILMDNKMPEITGVEATHIIKKDLPEIKIIGLSMYCEDANIQEFLDAGADTYLLKDCGIEEIQQAIHKVLEKPT